MKVMLSENIKRFRKFSNMTQEQLAEAMGVSVSAVYKWESNQSYPDIRLILQLADLFHTSTDVLLGYELQNRTLAHVVASIEGLAVQEEYEAGAREAEKALKSFPNSFELVYKSGLLYLKWCESHERAGRKRLALRAVELFNHACELFPENNETEARVSITSIKTLTAKAYWISGNAKESVRVLKKHNVCGVNNAMIGMVLADILHRPDEALTYLQRAFENFADNINDIMIGFTNVFFQRGDYRAAIDCLQWLRIVLRGIQSEEELTYFDKYECVLLESIAECYCVLGERNKAKNYLKRSLEKAIRYDKALPGERLGMKFFETLGLENQPNYKIYGKTAFESIDTRIMPSEEVPGLFELWQELKRNYKL